MPFDYESCQSMLDVNGKRLRVGNAVLVRFSFTVRPAIINSIQINPDYLYIRYSYVIFEGETTVHGGYSETELEWIPKQRRKREQFLMMKQLENS